MIKSFRDKQTQRVFDGEAPRGLPLNVVKRAMVKLDQIHSAEVLKDLSVPPGNRLEALVGDRVGQYSIRINDQWRLCFRWEGSDAYDVEITDYHR